MRSPFPPPSPSVCPVSFLLPLPVLLTFCLFLIFVLLPFLRPFAFSGSLWIPFWFAGAHLLLVPPVCITFPPVLLRSSCLLPAAFLVLCLCLSALPVSPAFRVWSCVCALWIPFALSGSPPVFVVSSRSLACGWILLSLLPVPSRPVLPACAVPAHVCGVPGFSQGIIDLPSRLCVPPTNATASASLCRHRFTVRLPTRSFAHLLDPRLCLHPSSSCIPPTWPTFSPLSRSHLPASTLRSCLHPRGPVHLRLWLFPSGRGHLSPRFPVVCFCTPWFTFPTCGWLASLVCFALASPWGCGRLLVAAALFAFWCCLRCCLRLRLVHFRVLWFTLSPAAQLLPLPWFLLLPTPIPTFQGTLSLPLPPGFALPLVCASSPSSPSSPSRGRRLTGRNKTSSPPGPRSRTTHNHVHHPRGPPHHSGVSSPQGARIQTGLHPLSPWWATSTPSKGSFTTQRRLPHLRFFFSPIGGHLPTTGSRPPSGGGRRPGQPRIPHGPQGHLQPTPAMHTQAEKHTTTPTQGRAHLRHPRDPQVNPSPL